MSDFDPDYYRLLHVQPDAPTEIIRASYRALMKSLKVHPDLGGDHREATRLNEAVEVLCAPDKRQEYDQKLAALSSGAGMFGRQAPDASDSRRDTGVARAAHHHHHAPVSTASPVPGPNSCAFCGESQPSHLLNQPSAVCRHCASPVAPVVKPPRVSRTRRALERMPRRIAVTISLAGSGLSFVTATEDISINGASFTSTSDMAAGQVLRLESSLWAAVCVVRHAQIETRGSRPRWRVGVEFLTLLVKTPDAAAGVAPD